MEFRRQENNLREKKKNERNMQFKRRQERRKKETHTYANRTNRKHKLRW